MLKFIRRNAEAAWVKVMFLAIVAVFIVWGIGGGTCGGEKVQHVARVNKEVIEQGDFVRAYNILLRNYQEILKENFNADLVKNLGLKQQAVDQLIERSLLQQEAERIGLRVGDSELRDAIAVLPTFQRDGKFDKDFYVRILRANNLTPADFEEGQRQELLLRKLQDLIAAGVHVSDADLHDRFRIDEEKVNLRFIKFEAPAFVSAVTVTGDELQAYYDKNTESFREPDRARIEYVLYSPEKFADRVDVTETDLQDYYQAHQSDYEEPERVRARQIRFEVPPGLEDDAIQAIRKHAEEVLTRAKNGEDFAALAKQYSDDPSASQGGDLGFFPHGIMIKGVEDAAFSLAPGAISDQIIVSRTAFHIVKVEEKEDAHTLPLDQVRRQVTAAMRLSKAKEMAQARAATDHDTAAAGETLAAIAERAGLTVSTPPPFAQSEAVSGIGFNPNLTKSVFAAGTGKIGPVVGIWQGPLLFRVTERIDAHVPPFADARGRVEEKLRAERAQVLAKNKAEAALAELQKSDIDAVARANHLDVAETGPFSRAATSIPMIGNVPDLKKAAFQLTTEKPVASAAYTVAGASILAVLKEHIPADEEKFKNTKNELRRQVEMRRQQQAMEEFKNYLKSTATIDTNQDFLASIVDTGHPLDGGPRSRR